MTAPLDGLLVADFSRVLAGPLATMTLADLGATVVKVERPGRGDDTRSWGPPWTAGSSAYFDGLNRSKYSLTLDLAADEDLEAARELAARADVLVHNLRPAGMRRDQPGGRLLHGHRVRAGHRPARLRLPGPGRRRSDEHHR
jgi:crotonobetainyl-CoA:carnitine CoA-transferase CaiB-like acyl-CoA transferase